MEISVNRICLTIVSREGREAVFTPVQPRYSELRKYQQRQWVKWRYVMRRSGIN
jgi:hypothetical protein